MPIFIFAKGKSNLYGLSGICLMLRILFLLVYQNLCFYKWRKNTNFKFLLLKTSNTPLIQCFLGVYIVLNFIWIFRVQGLLFLLYNIYIYILTYIYQIYRYFGRFAAWITYSKFTRKYTLFLAYTLKYRNLILHSACMPIIFCYIRLLVWSASRGYKYFIICYILCMPFLLSTVILLIVPFSIPMYS